MGSYRFRIGHGVSTLKRGPPLQLCCSGRVAERRNTESVGAEYRLEGVEHWHLESQVSAAEHGEDSATERANRANKEPE